MQIKENAEEFAQRMKKLFASNDEKWIAICLMSVCLEDFDAGTIWQNLIFWMRSIQQLVNSKPNESFLDLILSCIPKLLKISLEFEDLSREISINNIQPLLNNLVQTTGTKSRCLINRIAVFKECIICYPGPTGQFRAQIENICLALLSASEEALRNNACGCMALLPRCGSSGEKGTKFAEIWSRQFMMAIETLNFLIDDLFGSKVDIDAEDNRSTRTFRFNEVSLAEPEHSTVTGLRIESLLLVIEEMFSFKFPSVVHIDIYAVMRLCSRIFEKEINHQDSSIETVCLNAVLPQLWESVLSLINVLLGQMGSLLLPFENTVFQLAYQVLGVHEKGSDKRHDNVAVRRQGYQVLDTWNIMVGPLNCGLLQKIVEVILIDIQPCLQVNISVERKKEGKQKKKRDSSKLQAEILQGEMALKKVDYKEGSEIAFAALTLLATLISTTGPVMRAALMLKIQTAVISICELLMRPSKQTDYNFPAPYGNYKCREKLLLCAFRLTNLYHYDNPTPLSNLIRTFQDYFSDPSPIISKDSSVYLSLIDKIAHPSIPALREYSEEVAIDGSRSQKGASTPVLTTGLFDELHAISRQESTKASSYGSEKHRPVSSAVVSNLFSGRVSLPETEKERVFDNEELHSTQELPNNSNLIQLETPDSKKLAASKDKSFDVLRNEKSVEESSHQSACQYKEKQVDLNVEMNGKLAKRPKLDNNAYEKEREQSISEDVALDSVTSAHMQGAMQGDHEMMEVTTSKGEQELITRSDDESSMFLKSFVNSFPDSE